MSMIADQTQVSVEVSECAEALRRAVGDRSLDILWNKHLNRWCLVQRSAENKYPTESMIVGCLDNPESPPPRINMALVFVIEDGDRYIYPPAHFSWIVHRFATTCRRNDSRDVTAAMTNPEALLLERMKQSEQRARMKRGEKVDLGPHPLDYDELAQDTARDIDTYIIRDRKHFT